MSTVKSLEDLKRIKAEALAKRDAKATSGKAQVIVGMGTCGIAAGARETMKAILEAIETDRLEGIVVTQTGCIGQCEWEPIVEVKVGELTGMLMDRHSGSKDYKFLSFLAPQDARVPFILGFAELLEELKLFSDPTTNTAWLEEP